MSPIAICVGCGLAVNDSGVLIVDRNPDTGVESGLACTDANGLSLAIQHTDGACIDLTGLGTTASPLVASIDFDTTQANGLACSAEGLRVDVSPDDCNALIFHGNELYVPCHDSVYFTDTSEFGPVNQVMIAPGTFGIGNEYASEVYNIPNTTCCEVCGFIEARFGGLTVIQNPNSQGQGFVQVSIDGGAFGNAFPLTNIMCDNPIASGRSFDLNNTGERNLLCILPNDTVTYQFRFIFTQDVGSATLIGTGGWEVYYHGSHHNCCDEI